MADRFDLVVIGSGPGGYVAAIRAAQLGMNVACVEKYPSLGGTCLNVGCIPSKALLDSSEHFAFARDHAAAHGVRLGPPTLDLPTMMQRKDKVVGELTRGVETLFRKHKVTRVLGTGSIREPGVVEVMGGEARRELRAGNVLIATGSKAAALEGVPYDGRRIVHSTDALTLPEVPKRLLVIGAGAIGLELGSVWRRLGAEVLVLEFMDRIVPGMDGKSAALLRRSLERQGIKFQFGASATAARVEGGEVRVTVSQAGESREQVADVLLVAVGRRAYTDGLGAEALGIARDERGRIRVDEHYTTNVPGVWAIGDVIPGPMLAHKAEDEGIAAVERMAGQAGHVNYDAIPGVVYTWPEFAGVGLTEEDAAARGIAISVGTFPFLANGRAKAMGEREGQVKIVADAASDRILGAHIVGPRASDLIAELVLAIEMGASAEDVARTVHAHPTLPEAVHEAALGVGGRAIHI
ncbi:MAG TPA: dihydrolipoyl dehydrogenase [Candidatus Eisenbacteria bacterium]|nr:dihydrolipoyl dehydrogenase [Candidatus Eisenbacteria bacterium]